MLRHDNTAYSRVGGIALLPKPLPSDELAIGQFLTNPLHPETNSFFSSLAPTVEDLSDYFIQMRYKDLFSLDNEGRFAQSYGAKFDLGKVWRKPNLLSVNAEQMIYRTLKSPDEAFETVCSDPETQDWIRGLAEKGQELYFVCGIKELKNAKFKRAVLSDGGVSNKLLEKPIERGARVPRHVRRDSSLGLGAEACLSGVFGLDVRRVKARINNHDEPHVLDDLSYIWAYHKITGSPSKQLMIGLGEPVPAEELRHMLDLSEDDVAVNLDTISVLSADALSVTHSPMLRAHSPAFRGRSPSPHPSAMRI